MKGIVKTVSIYPVHSQDDINKTTAETSQIMMGKKNTGTGLLMSGVKWCLAMNQRFAL